LQYRFLLSPQLSAVVAKVYNYILNIWNLERVGIEDED
jgi:hypothetical protein